MFYTARESGERVLYFFEQPGLSIQAHPQGDGPQGCQDSAPPQPFTTAIFALRNCKHSHSASSKSVYAGF